MDVEQLFQDYGIYYQTYGHKHCRPGWANTECPFCTGNPGLHLGAAIGTTVFYCWRCGWKPADKAVAALVGVSQEHAKELIKRYGGRGKQRQPQRPLHKKPLKYPSDTGPLLRHHYRYLRNRGFDPEELEREWGLMATGPLSKLDKADYRHRILIPIYWNGEIVSFQARDVTDRSDVKYKACPKEREAVHHQEIVYGKPFLSWGRKMDLTGVCVEGVTDVWKMQRSPSIAAMATFGIEFTPRQLRTISRFERVVVLFDEDSQALVQAKKMVAELHLRGVKSRQITIKGDPAGLSNDEADQLIKEVEND